MNIFGRKHNRPSEPRSWDAVQDLIASLSLLCDGAGNFRRFNLETDGNGETTITMTVNNARFSGKGRSPWEAARHIATQAEKLSGKLNVILDDVVADEREAA